MSTVIPFRIPTLNLSTFLVYSRRNTHISPSLVYTSISISVSNIIHTFLAEASCKCNKYTYSSRALFSNWYHIYFLYAVHHPNRMTNILSKHTSVHVFYSLTDLLDSKVYDHLDRFKYGCVLMTKRIGIDDCNLIHLTNYIVIRQRLWVSYVEAYKDKLKSTIICIVHRE